ncbi:BPSS1780 family membrane protein [Piscinibacter koreensis]|uniref:Transmembrane protein n=1 Tax=Piscinibacter koreensis TaxID=2742824 RepID=A0A7Y6NLM6_9BURK|nr:BPSS1780 family membrane protein [Schlegelella koreensis]NUZ05415.1 hypothetical protein [Schlegelella koreensis]
MRLNLVAPARGAAWVRDGFRAFARYPLAFASVLVLGIFAMMVLSLVPLLGVVVLLVLLPAGSLLFMIATRHAQRREAPVPAAFVELARSPRERRIELLKLGAAYAAATLVVMALSDLIDGGALDAFVESVPTSNRNPDGVAARLAEPRLQIGLLMRVLLASLVSVPFWHAPALVHWGGVSWVKSLFFSSVAIWRNRGAFVVYALVWVGLMFGMLIAISLGLLVFGPAAPTILAMPLSLILTTVFYATLWFTFADCFAGEADSPRMLHG